MTKLMKRIVLMCVLALFVISSAAFAQDNNFIVRVRAESAIVRIAPSVDAQPSASVFRDDRLQVVSRNLDGLWFEVRRIGRLTNLGWIFGKVIEWDFHPEDLPLGDFVTGVIGPSPLTYRPQFGATLLEGASLRESPTRTGRFIRNVPPLVTIPVLERNQDGSWLHVNYLGYDGWIAGFTVRRTPNVLDIPEAAGLPALETLPVVIIPVEIQQAQIDRLREFILARREMAYNLEIFWWAVFRGEVMPCDAPEAVSKYPYTAEDVRELPELQRYTPRLGTAIDYLNDALAPFEHCGVTSPQTVIEARDGAINARVIFDATLDLVDILEKDVVQARR
jgi:hypothetical protein